MDILLNPNLAYLILMFGILLAMMSLVTPGTGLFEVGAFFCVLLAGYAIYHLSVNWWALVLLLLSIIPFVYAIYQRGNTLYLGVSIILLAVGSIFIFPGGNGEPGVHPLVAITVTVLMGGFLWFAVRKTLEAVRIKPTHDLEGLIGQFGEARTRIKDNGSVQVAGELWSARSENAIPDGSPIRVVAREGFILVVEEAKPSKNSQ
jgi:membrane-bound serine protease (ClpP class)